MADPRRYPDSTPYTTPRWVKLFGIIAIVVVLLVVLMVVSGRGHYPGHEPMSHTLGDRAPIADVHTPPADTSP